MKKKLIFVDDDVFMTDMYGQKLTNAGYEVKTYNDPEKALKDLEEKKFNPDMIVVDMIMPNIDGVEFIKRVRENSLAPDSLIVVLSNQSVTEYTEGIKDYNVAGTIVKANTLPSEVVAIIDSILARNSY